MSTGTRINGMLNHTVKFVLYEGGVGLVACTA